MVGHVEGRVLAHQDHVEAGEVQQLRRAEREMRAPLALDLKGARLGADAPLALDQGLRQIVEQRMPARLRLQRKGEGGIGVDIDALDRVHLDADGEAHGLPSRALE